MRTFLRWLVVIIGVLLTGVLGAIFYLTWRVSKRTGKGVFSSLVDIPEEAQLLTSETKSRVSGAIKAALKTAREKAESVKNSVL